jgi:SAM-dependent methyltransferase
MAHKEQREFCLSVRAMFPDFFRDKTVLDMGSLDINGSNRYLFEGCTYLGIDLARGKNVDVVAMAHEFRGGPFDTIISTEMLEHDMHYPDTLRNACDLLKPGGLLLFTCATGTRPKHGTEKSSPVDSPFTSAMDSAWKDYYQNLSEADIRKVLPVDFFFAKYAFSVQVGHQDLQFWGLKRGRQAW